MLDPGDILVNKLLQVFRNLLRTFPVGRMSRVRINLQHGITQRCHQRVLLGARENTFLVAPNDQVGVLIFFNSTSASGASISRHYFTPHACRQLETLFHHASQETPAVEA